VQPRPAVPVNQVLAGALAAVTAAVVGSTLGVAGTVIGAAIGSVIATVGSTVYAHWLQRTSHHVRAVVRRPDDVPSAPPLTPSVARPFAPPASAGSTETPMERTDELAAQWSGWTVPSRTAHAPARPQRRLVRWALVAAASVVAFVLGMGAITVFESLAGEPVSSLTTGQQGHGTTLGGSTRGDSGNPPPASPPSSTPPPTPDPTVSTPPPTDPPTTPPTTPPSDPTTTPPTTPPTGDPTDPPTGDPTDPPTTPPTDPPTGP
jgi:hypothetical protein